MTNYIVIWARDGVAKKMLDQVIEADEECLASK